MKKAVVIILLVLLVLGVAGMVWWNSGGMVKELSVTEVKIGSVRKTIDIDVTVRPSVYADISTEIPALVKKVYKKEGDPVEKGEVLFELDRDALRAQVAEARLAVRKAELAEKNARRHWRDLKPEERAEIVATTQQARENLRRVLAQAKKTTIISPLTGILTKQLARVGEVATGVVARVIDPDSLQAEGLVPEVDIVKVKEGMPVFLGLDSFPDNRIETRVKKIYPGSVEKGGNVYYKVDISLPVGLNALEGMTGEAWLVITSKEGVPTVERNFVQKDEKGYFVYVLGAGGKKPIEKYFQVGLLGDDLVEIKKGLSVGEKVVLVGSGK